MSGTLPTHDAQPRPPRFVWLKRFAAAGALLVVVVVGLRIGWGWNEQRKLDEVVAQIQAMGEPIEFDDLTLEPVPRSQDVAELTRDALAKWPRIDGVLVVQSDWYSEPEGFPDPIEDDAAYLAVVEAQVGGLLEQIAAAEEAVWLPRPLDSPVILVLFNTYYIGPVRTLARCMQDSAGRAVQTHDLASYFLWLHRILDLADACAKAKPLTTLDYVVALSLRSLVVDSLERMLPGLLIDVSDERAVTLARSLVARLNDSDHLRDQLIASLVGERWIVFDSMQAVSRCDPDVLTAYSGFFDSDLLGHPAWIRLVRPVYLAETRRVLLSISEQIRLVRDQQEHMVLDETDDWGWGVQTSGDGWSAVAFPMSEALVPALSASIRASMRLDAQQRMAALALAIKLYEAEQGQPIKALSDLVPGYLPAVPIDPFDPDGGPMRYQRDADLYFTSSVPPDRLIEELEEAPLSVLYSVGRDRADDGGRIPIGPFGGYDPIGSYEDNEDLLFLLFPAPVGESPDDPYNSGGFGP